LELGTGGGADHDVDAESAQRAHLVVVPVAASWLGHRVQSTGALPLNGREDGAHRNLGHGRVEQVVAGPGAATPAHRADRASTIVLPPGTGRAQTAPEAGRS
jgi:hypothetical protein